jgi:hypothetical protein
MTFRVEIATTNAAFTDESTDSPTAHQYAMADETARILRELADRVESDARFGQRVPLMDVNGNDVGFWVFE